MVVINLAVALEMEGGQVVVTLVDTAHEAEVDLEASSLAQPQGHYFFDHQHPSLRGVDQSAVGEQQYHGQICRIVRSGTHLGVERIDKASLNDSASRLASVLHEWISIEALHDQTQV